MSTTAKEQPGGVTVTRYDCVHNGNDDDLLNDKYNKDHSLSAMKKELQLHHSNFEPLYVGKVLLNVIGDLSGEL